MNTLGTSPALGYQFFSNDGQPLASGTLTIYLAGTTTPATTYLDAQLNATNTNPIVLNAAGRATIYFSPTNGTTAGVAYDIEVRDATGVLLYTLEDIAVPVPSTSGNLTDGVVGYGSTPTIAISGGAITPTKNAHMVSPEGGSADNLDNIAITGLPDGAPLIIGNSNGSAAITVRDNQGNIQLTGDQSCVLSNVTDRLTLIRKGTGWNEVARAVTGSQPASSIVCNGRLTLVSGNPVGEASGASTAYFTPYGGNRISLYNGITWQTMTFAETSFNNSGVSGEVYDVFAQNNGGTLSLTRSAWSNATTRATALALQDGVLVDSNNPVRRYIGTIANPSGGTTTSDVAASRLVWNYYNRINRSLLRLDSTASWSYNTATWRQAGANAANQVVVVTGVAEDAIDLNLDVTSIGSASTTATIGIGIDSTTTPSVLTPGGLIQMINTTLAIGTLGLRITPTIGRHAYTWLESGTGGAPTVLWIGEAGTYRSGLFGMTRA